MRSADSKSLGYAFKPATSSPKRCGGSKQAVLREKLAHKAETTSYWVKQRKAS